MSDERREYPYYPGEPSAAVMVSELQEALRGASYPTPWSPAEEWRRLLRDVRNLVHEEEGCMSDERLIPTTQRQKMLNAMFAPENTRKPMMDAVADALEPWLAERDEQIRQDERDRILKRLEEQWLEAAQEDAVVVYGGANEEFRFYIEEGANHLAAYIGHYLQTAGRIA